MTQLAISLAGAAVGNFIAPGIGGQVGFALGSAIGGYVTQTDPPTQYGPKIEDGKVSSSAYGIMIPKVWGTVDVAGNIIDVSPLVTVANESEVGGKGSPTQTVVEYEQFINYDVALCDGCDGIIKIFANERLIYDASPGVAVQRPAWLNFDFYEGSETQAVDATFEATRGTNNIPAYRGVAHVVFRNWKVTEFGTTAVNFRFVITSAGTASTSTTEYNQGPTGTTPNIIHNPYTDLMIGVVRRDLDIVDGDGFMLIAIDAYSETKVWESVITDANAYKEAEFVLQCGSPEVDDLGVPVYPPNYLLAVYHRQTPSNPNNRFFRFFMADSGEQVALSAIQASESNPYAVSCFPDDAIFYQPVIISGAVSMRRIDYTFSNGVPTQSSNVSVTAPSGYDWYDANTERIWVAQGSRATTDAATLCAMVENQSTAALGFVTWEDSAVGLGASTYAPFYNAVDEVANGTPIEGVYDPSEECFWVTLRYASDTIFARIDLDGTLASETNWDTAFSITGEVDSVTIDTARDLLWVVNGGIAYSWPTYDTSQAPNGHGSGIKTTGLAFHPYNWRLWASDTSYWQYYLNQLTGGRVSLQTVVENICDEDGTNLLTADRAATALSAITVDGLRLTAVAQRRVAIDTLRKTYLFDFVPRSAVLTAVLRGGASTATLDDDLLGAHVYGSDTPPRLSVTRTAADQIPQLMGVTFIDASQNYETGYEQATRQASTSGTESRMQIPIVISHDDAAQLSSTLLHAQNIEAENYQASCMPSTYDEVIPAAVITADVDSNSYQMVVESANVIDGGIVEMTGRRYDASVYSDFSVGGTPRDRASTVASVGTTQLIAADLPAVRESDLYVGYYVGGASYSPTWPGAVIYQSGDNLTYGRVATISTETTYGFLTEALPTGSTTDLENTLSVRLIEGSLSSLTHDTMQTDRESNYAAIGASGRWEIIRFQTATLTAGVYALTILHRGLRDTLSAKTSSAAGDKFILLDADGLRRVSLPSADVGVSRWLKAVSIGRVVVDATATQFASAGRSVQPFRPTALDASVSGNWTLTWVRQDKQAARFLQQPQMSESTESYTLDILNLSGDSVREETVTSETFTYTSAMQTSDFGGAVSVLKWRVRQDSSLVATEPYTNATSGSYDIDYDALVTARGSLVDFWALDETSGTNAASNSTSHDGTYSGDYTLNSTSLTLDKAPSVRINPTSNTGYVDISPGAWSAAIRAVDFVLRPNNFSGPSQDQGVVWSSLTNGGGNGWAVMLTQAGNLTFRAGPSNVWLTPDTVITSATVLTLGETYHVQVNFGATSGDDVEIYIDGILDASGTMASTVTIPGTGFFRVGAMLQHLRSNIAKVGVYNANLTQADAIAGALSAKGIP